MAAWMATAFGFLMLLFRVGALCIAAPHFGARTVPARIRLGLAVALTVPLFMGAGMPAVQAPEALVDFIRPALTETMIGLVAGTVLRIALEAAAGAAHLAGVSMGLSYGAMLDPFNGAESSALQQLLSPVAVACAIGLGLHRELLAWLAASIRSVPLGSGADLNGMFSAVIWQSVWSFSLAIRLGFPVVAASMIGHLLLGVGGRIAPQLNLSNMGFTVSILAGSACLYLLAPTIAELAAREALASFSQS